MHPYVHDTTKIHWISLWKRSMQSRHESRINRRRCTHALSGILWIWCYVTWAFTITVCKMHAWVNPLFCTKLDPIYTFTYKLKQESGFTHSVIYEQITSQHSSPSRHNAAHRQYRAQMAKQSQNQSTGKKSVIQLMSLTFPHLYSCVIPQSGYKAPCK